MTTTQPKHWSLPCPTTGDYYHCTASHNTPTIAIEGHTSNLIPNPVYCTKTSIAFSTLDETVRFDDILLIPCTVNRGRVFLTVILNFFVQESERKS